MTMNEQFDRPPDMRVFLQNEIQFLFVYGTLKRTFPRAHLLTDCLFVVEDKIKGYLMHINNEYPAAVLESKAGFIHGEIYRLPENKEKFENLVHNLDKIEGFPSLFWRLPIRTFKNYMAWVYFFSRDRLHNTDLIIPSGKWVGPKSETVRLARHMNDNPDLCWPGKPKVKYYQEVKSGCVEQYNDSGHTYSEVFDEKYYKPGPATSFNYSYSLKTPLPREPEPMFDLVWLDAPGVQPEVCEEIYVDGI